MRVYPLSDYRLKELKLAELQKKHFKSPLEALYQKNKPYFENQKPSGFEVFFIWIFKKMEDFVSHKWKLLT